MKKIILCAGLAMTIATPAMANGIAVCTGSIEDRNGLTDFSAYTLAQSDVPAIGREALKDEAERSFRASYSPQQRITCRAFAGTGHYVVVRAAQALNGRVIQLIGFGFGSTREDALAASRADLDGYPDYHMFIGRGGELEVVEEGSVDS